MSDQTVTEPLVAPGIISDIEETGEYVVVIFNNDYTSVDRVVDILIIATGCDEHEAAIETWEAHTFGSAAVHRSTKTECETIARTISSIGIVTEVRKETADV